MNFSHNEATSGQLQCFLTHIRENSRKSLGHLGNWPGPRAVTHEGAQPFQHKAGGRNGGAAEQSLQLQEPQPRENIFLITVKCHQRAQILDSNPRA